MSSLESGKFVQKVKYGCELADSWANDAHKWLNVPYDSGYAFVADAEAQRPEDAVQEPQQMGLFT